MEKRWALSTWFASLLILFCGFARAGELAQDRWDQMALDKPEVVSAWLKENAKTADRKRAQVFFDEGTKYEKKGHWSMAVKSFGASALYFPTPMALIGDADNTLRSLSTVRARQKDTSKSKSDLEWALGTYRSALAAEEQLKMLSAQDLAQLKADEACLDTYLKAPSLPIPKDAACRPLKLYAHSPPG